MSINEKAISWKQQGDDYFKQGKYDIAIRSYAEALKIDPDFISAWNNMGFAYYKLGRREDAKKCKDKIKLIKETKKEHPIPTSKTSQMVHSAGKSPGLAILLSVIFPGLGQVYNGDIKKGFFILIEIILGIFSFVIPGIIVWFYSIYDSYKTAHEMNVGVIPTKSANFGQIFKYVVISFIFSIIALITFGFIISLFESGSTIISVIFLLLFIAVIIVYSKSQREVPSASKEVQIPSNQQSVENVSSSLPTADYTKVRHETELKYDFEEPKSKSIPPEVTWAGIGQTINIGDIAQGESTVLPYQRSPPEIFEQQDEDSYQIISAGIIPTSGINWAGFGQSLTIGSYTIQNALTYWSRDETSSTEASCIDIRKQVGSPSNIEPLPYWPKYSGLNPGQSGYYLSWLSRGKPGDIDEIGYVFLYFYGLERRALVEKSDFNIIFNECLRLLSTFTHSRSFTSYVSEFLAFLIGLHLNDIDEQELHQYFPDFDNLSPKMLDVILSWYTINNVSVPWELAYPFAKNSIKTVKTTVVKKSPDIFKNLFQRKFLNRYPERLQLNSTQTQRRLEYRPASPTLMAQLSDPDKRKSILTIILRIPGSDQFNEILSIWAECVEELKPVSNKLNKTDGKITRDVYAVFPVELKKEISHPDKKIWQDLVSSKKSNDGQILVKISELAQLVGIEKRDILTPKLSKDLENTATDVGFTLIPNFFVLGTSYKWNDPVALLENPDPNTQPSENIEKVALIFEMAYAIAIHDGNFSEAEQNFLYNSLTNRFQLNPADIVYLKTLQSVLEIQSPPVIRIGRRLTNHLNSDQKLTLAHFLSDVISLENKLEGEERKILKTVYKSLSIEPSIAEDSINRFIQDKLRQEPVSVSKPKISRTGEVIPAPVPEVGITIDQKKLDEKIRETIYIQEILGRIFEQEQEETSRQEISDEFSQGVKVAQAPNNILITNLPFPPDSVNRLDPKYLPILSDILTSREFTKEDFTNLVRKHNLMPGAVLDEINSWADEELGDFLIIENENGFVTNDNYLKDS